MLIQTMVCRTVQFIGRPEGALLSRTVMKFPVTLERDEDGVWIAECPSVPGCSGQGKTREDAMEDVKSAIAVTLETRAAHGLPLTLEMRQVEVTV
jgi:predicted RNase H-like HicB family nuclease